MLIKAKNKVTGNVTLVPERYLKFNKNYVKAKKSEEVSVVPEADQTIVATEDKK